MTRLGHDLAINFGFIVIKVQNKNLSYKYDGSFVNQLNRTEYELKVGEQSEARCANRTWQRASTGERLTRRSGRRARKEVINGRLNHLLTRPNPNQV